MLSDLSFKELNEYVKGLNFPSFRSEQIFDGIYSGKSLDEISNLPKGVKEIISKDYPKYAIYKKFISKDGTEKYIIRLFDGNIVECVLMKYKYGYTICLSTQVGCRMGCKFCASTLGGKVRDLSAGEILAPIILVNREKGGSRKDRKITNVVLMGSGEPFDNYDNVIKFLSLVTAPEGFNISERNISISTCGIVDKIYDLAKLEKNITLTISLHSTLDSKRREIMPIANKFSIKEILDACKYYFDKTGRKIYFEYTLIKGVNDSEEDVDRLAHLLKGLMCHVNLIPLNQVKERTLASTGRLYAYKFMDKLKSKGVSATVRRTMGEDIEGACGQLRNKILDEEAK